MATSSKTFRTRAFDSQKPMAIFYGQEIPDLSECATGTRAVTLIPTGMEKEEEMESHLQEAIIAQQASTSGIRYENHVIPTPKVIDVTHDRYHDLYEECNKPCASNKPNFRHYIKVHAWLALEKEEPDYDMDTDDETWLSERPHIKTKVLERIFDVLEAQSSDNSICLPAVARNALISYDEAVVDDVYDYWLSKRTSATTSQGNLATGGLIPKVRTETRKDGQGTVNPYVAFRRRAEKMQTRKNRKNDEDAYEKVLKLHHDLGKAQTMFDMTRRREKCKLALIDLEADMLMHRMKIGEFGCEVFTQFAEKLGRPENSSVVSANHLNGTPMGVSPSPSKFDNDAKPKKKKVRRSRPSLAVDREVPSKAWLKQNLEIWNRVPSLHKDSNSPVQEVDRSAQAIQDANLDGRYTFKRRRGCVYRAAQSILPLNNNLQSSSSSSSFRAPDSVPIRDHFFETFLPNTKGQIRSVGFARRRVGRGGRVVFDRVVSSTVPRVPSADSFDPWAREILEDRSKTFRARLHPFGEWDEAEDEMSEVERVFDRSECNRFDDSARERTWLGSYRRHGEPKRAASTGNRTDPDADAQIDGRVSNGVPHDSPPRVSEPMEEDENEQNEEPPVRKTPTSNATSVPTPRGGKVPSSGNGLAGRVEPTTVPGKMCGTASASDEWRSGSGSPSESNSSTEWTTTASVVPQQQRRLPTSFAASVGGSDNEQEQLARTGDHPVAKHPTVKETMAGVTMLDCKYIMAPAHIGS